MTLPIILLMMFIFISSFTLFFYYMGLKIERRNRYLSVISNKSNVYNAEEMEQKRKEKQRADVIKKLKASTDEQMASKKDKTSVKTLMQQAGIDADVSQYWLFAVIFTGIVFLLTTLVGMPIIAKFFVLFTAFMGVPKFFLNWKAARRQRKFLEGFSEVLDAMGRLLQSGIPISEAISMGAREYEGPIQEELIRVYDNQKVGIPLGEATLLMAHRVPLPEVYMFASALQIQSETGSSLSEVLGNLSTVIRERFKLKRKVKALSSEAKSSAAIIAALPVLVTLGLYLARPEYIGILFTLPKGKVILGCAVGWMSLGVLMMRQMINFKV